MRRRLGFVSLVAAAVAAALVAGAARAGSGLVVGVDDDTLKWAPAADGRTALAAMHDLGVTAVRITVPWYPGETRLAVADRKPLDRAMIAAWGSRVVLAVYGKPDDAPQTADDRTQYCSFVADLLRRYPGVGDVVIWNEPNKGVFWRPQYDQLRSSVAPAAYEALLARCWDVLHEARPSVNVIAASASRGADNPAAAAGSTSPGVWYRGLGDAYRASGRSRPIFDTVGHNPYPDTSSERPWAQHATSGSIGEGDYGKLMAALGDAFGGTGQPLPGQANVRIWYMEQGFQSTVDPSKRRLYSGSETDRQALPASSPAAAATGADGPAPDQATQVANAVELASCQPAVAAFFNFELADEPDLSGWQSGLMWPDLTPKPAYQAFKQAVANVRAGTVDCSRFPAAAIGAAPPAPAGGATGAGDQGGVIGFTIDKRRT